MSETSSQEITKKSSVVTVKARCLDPRGGGCVWAGEIWIDVTPKAEACQPCPNCGGFEFRAEVKMAQMQKERRVVLRGFTS